jgi:hypothetical protein
MAGIDIMRKGPGKIMKAKRPSIWKTLMLIFQDLAIILQIRDLNLNRDSERIPRSVLRGASISAGGVTTESKPLSP